MSQPNESGTQKDLVLYRWKNKFYTSGRIRLTR